MKRMPEVVVGPIQVRYFNGMIYPSLRKKITTHEHHVNGLHRATLFASVKISGSTVFEYIRAISGISGQMFWLFRWDERRSSPASAASPKSKSRRSLVYLPRRRSA